MDLYSLTRKLIERGCPEPQVVDCAGTTSAAVWYSPESDESCGTGGRAVWFVNTVNGFTDETSEGIARAIWTMWALEWWRTIGDGNDYLIACKNGDWSAGYATHDGIWDGDCQPSLLEIIEIETRHLEP